MNLEQVKNKAFEYDEMLNYLTEIGVDDKFRSCINRYTLSSEYTKKYARKSIRKEIFSKVVEYSIKADKNIPLHLIEITKPSFDDDDFYEFIIALNNAIVKNENKK